MRQCDPCKEISYFIVALYHVTRTYLGCILINLFCLILFSLRNTRICRIKFSPRTGNRTECVAPETPHRIIWTRILFNCLYFAHDFAKITCIPCIAENFNLFQLTTTITCILLLRKQVKKWLYVGNFQRESMIIFKGAGTRNNHRTVNKNHASAYNKSF